MEINTNLIGNVYYDNITDYHYKTYSQTSTLLDVVAVIVNYNFQWRFTTLLIINQFNIPMINIFLKQLLKPIVINYGKVDDNYLQNVTQFIIFGRREDKISTALERIHIAESINKLIVVCEDLMKCNEDVIFQNANQRKIYNIVFVKFDGHEKVAVVSQCYINLFLCNRNSKVHKINCSIHPAQKNYTCLRSIFNNQHFLEYHKCPVTFLVGHSPPYASANNLLEPTGSIIYFLRLIADMANLKIAFKIGNQSCSAYLKNNGNLLNLGQADATLCGVSMFINKYEAFETSYPLGSFEVVWVNTLTEGNSEWMKLIYPLDYDLRTCIFALFVSIIIINCFAKTKIWHKMFPSFGRKFTNRSFLLLSWSIFLGVPVAKVSSNRSFKIMVYTWMWFCFIVRSAYEGALYDTLKYKNVEPQVTNIQDVHRLGRKFGGQAAYREFYVDEPEIYDNWVILNESRTLEIRDEILAGTTDFTLATSKAKVMHAANDQKKPLDRLNFFPKKIISSHIVIYFRKYSGLATYLNRIIGVTVEGGFYPYLEARYIDHIEKRSHKINNLKPINLYGLQGPLIIWCTGIFISFVCFTVELLFGRCYDFFKHHRLGKENN